MPSFKRTPVPFTILHPFDAPCHPTSSRSRLPLKQSRSSFTATSANSTIALYFRRVHSATLLTLMFHPPTRANLLWRPHSASCLRGGGRIHLLLRPIHPSSKGHICLPNNRDPLSWRLLLLFHSHFCLPNNRATHRRRFDLPNNRAILRRANSPTEFTLTYMPQNTLASLFATPNHPPYTHFCLPHDCSAISVSQLPPNTIALLAHDRFCVCPVIRSLSDKLT